MINFLRKRKKNMLKAGDVVRAKVAGIKGIHTCVILEDEPTTGHFKCLAFCNFTGSEVPLGEYSIDISEFELPDNWFDTKKPQTWLRCNAVDCVHSIEITKEHKLGNILVSFPKLWTKVCTAVHSCEISERLASACDCDYKIIEKEIKLEKRIKSDCGCKR
jgi:hypothetical protein